MPLILLLLLSRATQAHTQAAAAAAAFAPEPCPFWSVEESARYRVECGKLSVAAADSADARRYLLQVVILRSHKERLHNEANVVIPGGPGADLIRRLAPSLARHPLQDSIRQHRDIVLMDPRGTGYSEPTLCPELDATESRASLMRLGVEEATAVVRRELAQCRIRLQQSGVDPAGFNSAAHAGDLEALRAALGYDALTLTGISYGTRVALETMRRYPQSVRSAILYGPLPPDAPWAIDDVQRVDATLKRLVAQCTADTRCRATYPRLEVDLGRVLEELDADPLRMRTPWGAFEIDGSAAWAFIAFSLFDSDFLPYVPLAIQQLRRRHAAFLQPFIGAALGQGVSAASYYAAMCSELSPGVTPSSLEQPRDSLPSFRSSRGFQPDLPAVCDAFVLPSADQTLTEPVRSAVPTLILTGEFDPSTPPEYGWRASRTLSNSHVLVMRGRGHDVNVPTPCTVAIRASFLEDPTQPPDTSCIAAMPPLRFATDVHVSPGIGRVAWNVLIERRATWVGGLALLLLSLILTVVLLPVFRRPHQVTSRGKAPAMVTAALWGAAALALLFTGGIGVALATAHDPYVALFGVGGSWSGLFVLPFLIVVLAAAGLVGMVIGAYRGWWSSRSRAAHVLAALVNIAFITVMLSVRVV